MRPVTRSEVRAIVREEIRRAQRGIVAGRVTETEDTTYRAVFSRILHGEDADRIKRVAPYGFISRPLGPMESFLGPILGSSRNLIYFGENDTANRPGDLEPGEVALYTDEGDQLGFRRGNEVYLKAGALFQVLVDGSSKLELDDENAEINVATLLKLVAGATLDVDGVTIDIDGTTITIDGTTITVTGTTTLTFTCGGHTVVITSAGVTIDGIIFHTHEHGGVSLGYYNTGGPENP